MFEYILMGLTAGCLIGCIYFVWRADVEYKRLLKEELKEKGIVYFGKYGQRISERDAMDLLDVSLAKFLAAKRKDHTVN